MYDKLVERLNKYSAEHEHHGGITAEAADAIEELESEGYDEPDDSQLEMGFDPYEGCYTDDC